VNIAGATEATSIAEESVTVEAPLWDVIVTVAEQLTWSALTAYEVSERKFKFESNKRRRFHL
jgi:hypothetical protein